MSSAVVLYHDTLIWFEMVFLYSMWKIKCTWQLGDYFIQAVATGRTFLNEDLSKKRKGSLELYRGRKESSASLIRIMKNGDGSWLTHRGKVEAELISKRRMAKRSFAGWWFLNIQRGGGDFSIFPIIPALWNTWLRKISTLSVFPLFRKDKYPSSTKNS